MSTTGGTVVDQTGSQPGFWDWPYDPAYAATVAGWGFWLSIIGLILTIAGFGFTIWQLLKTRSAADAAKAEAARIEQAFNRYEVVNEATRASAALATARIYLRNDLWIQVADSYESVRNSLGALSLEHEILSLDHRTRISVAIQYIQKLCPRIEREVEKNRIIIDKAKTLSIMADHNQLLNEITRAIQKDLVK